ncbi:DMT family protein [Microbulbifer harenosus]|uniref:DMT family protein n=1 Tax=Microbulbifer harenosus TaxID=2576840 RepID=A0ABY2UHM1_9GAMM|nr:DMT family protein [Microbulbifer harenosus]
MQRAVLAAESGVKRALPVPVLAPFLFRYPIVHPILTATALLVISNVFMTFAWYSHLKELSHKPWIIAALLSWGIALFEYLFQVPANRVGYSALNVGQLKILQEVITLSVFVPFAVYYLKEPLKLDYLWAGLCILGAVFFIFRSKWAGA